MTMNGAKRTALAAVLVGSHLATFILGWGVNRHVLMQRIASEDLISGAEVDLGLYMDYRDTAIAIIEKRLESALCAAQLGASGRYDDIKHCLADSRCKASVEQRVREHAPELLGEVPLKFEYIEARNGVRSCERQVKP